MGAAAHAWNWWMCRRAGWHAAGKDCSLPVRRRHWGNNSWPTLRPDPDAGSCTWPPCLQEAAPRQALVQREESRRCRLPLLLSRLLLLRLLLLALRGPCSHGRRLLLLPCLLLRLLPLPCHLVSGLVVNVQRRKLGVQVGGEPVGRLQSVQQLRRRRAAQRVVNNLRPGWHTGRGGHMGKGGISVHIEQALP